MTSPQLQLIELLYDAADDPGEPQLAVLSMRFLKLLHDEFDLKDQNSHLPQFAQLEVPLWHVAKIAGTFNGIDDGRNAYVKALGFGIGHLHSFGPLDKDVLGLWLSCARPGHAEQLALVYKREWCKFPESKKLKGLQRLLIGRRLGPLLKSGLFEKAGQEAASKALLGWLGFPESHDPKQGTHTFTEALSSLRFFFFYNTDADWSDLTEERCRRSLEVLAGGLLLLREHNREFDIMVDLLVLRMIIHWRPWQTPGQVVAAYGSLEGLSEFLPTAFIESRMYKALSKEHIVRLRMPDELVQVGAASIAQSATTFLCYNEPEELPSRNVLCHWIDMAVEMVIDRPLLALAYAQESLLPPGPLRGQPRKLKLLPFLGSRSDLARQEKHTLLKDLPRLLTALGNFDLAKWDDDTVSESLRLLFQGVAYEWHDRGEDEVPPFDLPKIQRLKKTRELLKQIRRKLPALPRLVIGVALDDEIALLDRRLRPN